MTYLRGKDLKVTYENKYVLDALNITIPQGKITTIIGPNGCGKSTLLQTLSRIIKPKKGYVYLNDIDVNKMATKAIAQKLAILPQNPETPPNITVQELLEYGRYAYQSGWGELNTADKEAIAWSIQATNIEAITTEFVSSLSGGQRQRVWIALALVQETELILLDEPTTYLDMKYQLEVCSLLKKMNEELGKTIVMVLHDLNLASRFSDYLIAMKDGEIIKDGSAQEIMTQEILKHVFEIDAELMIKDEKPLIVTYNLIK